MRNNWILGSVAVIGISVSAVYGSWMYVRSVARETFESDTVKVKQSFYEGVKAAESAVQSLKSFTEAIDEGDQGRFGKFSADLISKLPFMVGTTYYRHVPGSERAAFERSLKARGLGSSIMEVSASTGQETVVTAGDRAEYFAVDTVDQAARDQSYFGWDALSDQTKAGAISASIAQQQAVATGTFLLESGNVAFEVFAPVYLQDGKLRGVVGATVDLTKMLGEQRWREGVTIIMTTVLSGESTTKDIYRSLDQEPVRMIHLGSLFSNIEVERFGQKLGLKFEKALFPGRINLSIVALAAAGCVLLSILAFYLLLTYERLQISLASLAEANVTLEEKVAMRTKELAVAHAEIKEILDNLDEVVFAVDPNRKIGPIYSPASRRLLEHDDFAGLDLLTVLFKDLDPHNEEASRHIFACQMLATLDEFQWSISSGDFLRMCQYKLKNGSERTFSLRYSPVFVADTLRKLIVVASDVTEIMSLKESLAAFEKEASTKEAVLSELAAANKSQLRGFFDESDDRMTLIESFMNAPQHDQVLEVLRALHTVKGGSRSVGLKSLARKVHEIEDGLETLRSHLVQKTVEHAVSIEKVTKDSQLSDGCRLYAEYRKVFRELFDAAASVSIPQLTSRILPFLKSTSNERADLVRWYEDASTKGITSISDLVGEFAHSISELSTQLSKKVDLQIPKWDLYVDPKLKGALHEAFVHALRNAVDHGIERPEVRTSRGKPEVGHIWLEHKAADEAITLSVVDDGGGVDAQRVYDIARSKGLVSKPFAELPGDDILDLLFMAGFSTKSEISDVSGRGIGLDAVRTSLATFGVHCRISSKLGQGSRFEFIVPRKFFRYASNEKAELLALAS